MNELTPTEAAKATLATLREVHTKERSPDEEMICQIALDEFEFGMDTMSRFSDAEHLQHFEFKVHRAIQHLKASLEKIAAMRIAAGVLFDDDEDDED